MNKNNNIYSDNWSVVEGEFNNTKILVRIREVDEKIDISKYPFQIGINVPFIDKTEEDLPSDKEVGTLDKIEDTLCDIFESKYNLIMVLVITSKDNREFVFYGKDWDPELFKKEIEDLNEKFSGHSLQFMMRKDEDWSTYFQFAE